MELTFEFENLGPIEYANIKLEDLTVICGENNTGKTYVTYLVYCLLYSWRHLVDINLEKEFLDLNKSGVVKINLQEKIADSWEKICSTTFSKFKEKFPEMLASKRERFSNFSFKIQIPLGSKWKIQEYKEELRSAKGNLLITMTKLANSVELELAAPQSEDKDIPSMSALSNFIEEHLFNMMLEETTPNVFIASTERTGATTFQKQLNLATNNIIELLSKAHQEGAGSITPVKVFETIYGRQEYALPIRHNVQIINQLPDPNAEESELYKIVPELLNRFENIVGGTYVTNKEGVTYFQPRGTRIKLGLAEVSSSVRSLLLVWYWLKYFAKKGSMLILDEPELNLHPVNQRRLARFLVALINNGIKVFITTHSDYIIKEFNTLIMLNHNAPQLEQVREKLQEYLPEDKLAYDRVALYMTGEEKILKPGGTRKTKVQTLIRAKVSPTLGIEVQSFDKNIDAMNAIQEAIYYASN